MKKRVLLAGETFAISQSISIGFDTLHSNILANGASHYLSVMSDSNYEIEQLSSDRCENEFPKSAEALAPYAAVILSDIGALSLLLSPETRAGKVSTNRLALLHDWVARGGGLLMAGGYNSFQGMSGTARYHDTKLEDCLPVDCLPYADGLEAPEGLAAQIIADHPIIKDLKQPWPPVLGINKVKVKPEDSCKIVATVTNRHIEYPLLATRGFGKGRTAAWMTDIGPHWLSQEFLNSETYALLMRNMTAWICRDI